ncbi:MAG: peptidyl-prolyl cis-trans isomerase [Candidatus Aminicenantales bacterium]
MRKAVVALVLLGLAGTGFLAAAPQVVEEIVAVVNDDIITLSQYKQQFEIQLQTLKAAKLPQEEYDKQYKIMKADLLNAMITELLVLQQAKEMNLNVAEELKNNIAAIKKDNNFSSDDDLRRAVQQQGISYEQWLKQYEETLLKQLVMVTEVYRSIALDESEVVQYYKQHPQEFTVPAEFKLGAIYLDSASRTPEALEALKAEISGKVKGGTAFADVAAALSDPPFKDAKGDMGTFKKGELDKTLEEAVDKLKAGEVSPWVKTKTGWYLLKLDDKKDSYLRTFDEARSEVQEKLMGAKRQKKSEEYIASLKEHGYIKILKPNPLDY